MNSLAAGSGWFWESLCSSMTTVICLFILLQFSLPCVVREQEKLSGEGVCQSTHISFSKAMRVKGCRGGQEEQKFGDYYYYFLSPKSREGQQEKCRFAICPVQRSMQSVRACNLFTCCPDLDFGMHHLESIGQRLEPASPRPKEAPERLVQTSGPGMQGVKGKAAARARSLLSGLSLPSSRHDGHPAPPPRGPRVPRAAAGGQVRPGPPGFFPALAGRGKHRAGHRPTWRWWRALGHHGLRLGPRSIPTTQNRRKIGSSKSKFAKCICTHAYAEKSID